MNNYRTIALGFFAMAIFFLIMMLMTGCAVTWPTKAGHVTLSFSPPAELINKYGASVFDSPTLQDK